MAATRNRRGPLGDPSSAPAPALTVSAVAGRLGVAPATLRTWDRRYGLGPSAHTAGAHRRYGPGDLGRLMAMRRLTLEGVPPAEAARVALTGPVSPWSAVATVTELPGRGVAGSTGSGPDAAGTVRRPGGSGGGRVVALPHANGQARGLARAAMSLDTHETNRLLREAVRTLGVVRAWETLALPVLTAIGERWSATGEGVDVEHAYSEALLGVTRGVCAALGRPRNARPVLLTCAEGDHHTLPLHVLAAALAEQEIGSRMMGVGMPPRALLAAARRCGPSVIFVFARLPVGDTSVLQELPRRRPAPAVIVGGPGWQGTILPDAVTRVSSLHAAVDQVRLSIEM